jgi:hypothetical protein
LTKSSYTTLEKSGFIFVNTLLKLAGKRRIMIDKYVTHINHKIIGKNAIILHQKTDIKKNGKELVNR